MCGGKNNLNYETQNQEDTEIKKLSAQTEDLIILMGYHLLKSWIYR